VNRKLPAEPVRAELRSKSRRIQFDPQFLPKIRVYPSFGDQCNPPLNWTYEPTMGNSPSSGLGSGSAHGLRDVRTANPETEVQRPQASTEPNENPRDLILQVDFRFRQNLTETMSFHDSELSKSQTEIN